MSEQLTMFEQAVQSENLPYIRKKKQSAKRRWEYAFQKWSDEQSQDGSTAYGACGYGSMCEWCSDNSYGRPCVRALNAMCREKGIAIDYSDKDFCKVWRGADDERSR